jgi:hypothetical protein
MFQVGGNTLCSENHKRINYIRNEEELSQQWKKYIVPIHIYIKSEQLDCSNYLYRGTSILSVAYNILCKILLSSLTPYVGEVIGDRHCGFRTNRPTAEQKFCVHQILQKSVTVTGEYVSYL